MIAILSGVENDLHRHSLDDLHVVAGSIFGGKQAEGWAGGASDAVDAPFQGLAGGIDVDIRSLPNAHVTQLRFFKIGRDPYFIERYDGEELLPGHDVHADDNGLVYFASYRRDDLRVLQVQLSLLESGSFLLHVSDGRAHARLGR